jgi:hypothetical protein
VPWFFSPTISFWFRIDVPTTGKSPRQCPLLALSGQSRHRNNLSVIGQQRTTVSLGPRRFVR